jgi:hypothetical protein
MSHVFLICSLTLYLSYTLYRSVRTPADHELLRQAARLVEGDPALLRWINQQWPKKNTESAAPLLPAATAPSQNNSAGALSSTINSDTADSMSAATEYLRSRSAHKQGVDTAQLISSATSAPPGLHPWLTFASMLSYDPQWAPSQPPPPLADGTVQRWSTDPNRCELWALLPETSVGMAQLHVVGRRVLLPNTVTSTKREDGRTVILVNKSSSSSSLDSTTAAPAVSAASSSPAPSPPEAPSAAFAVPSLTASLADEWALTSLTLHFPHAHPHPIAYVLDRETERFVCKKGVDAPPAHPSGLSSSMWQHVLSSRFHPLREWFESQSTLGQIATVFLSLSVPIFLFHRLYGSTQTQIGWSRRLLCQVRDHPEARRMLQLRSAKQPGEFVRRGPKLYVQQNLSEMTPECRAPSGEISAAQLKQEYTIDSHAKTGTLYVNARKIQVRMLGGAITWGRWKLTKLELSVDGRIHTFTDFNSVTDGKKRKTK